MGFLHSPGYNHKVIFLLCISSELQAYMCKHANCTHIQRQHWKRSLLSAQHWWKATHCELQSHSKMSWRHAVTPTASLSLSVSPAEWGEGGENSQRPSSVWCVAPNETRRYQEPLLCWIYVWHWCNEAIWLWILHRMSINPQMPNTQTKKSCIF